MDQDTSFMRMRASSARFADGAVIDEPTDSRIVSYLLPLEKPGSKNGNGNNSNSSQRNAFKKALYSTFNHAAEGVISPYLFYDPPKAQKDQNSHPWGVQDEVAYGAKAWDVHISESTDQNASHAKQNAYSFAEGDVEAINTALEEGLLERLPRLMTFYSYGPGELIAVRQKDCLLIENILDGGFHRISSFNAVDINDRYAYDAVHEVHQRFNLESKAIHGDFMEGQLMLGNKVGTSVVAVFGGPFANAPAIKGAATAKQKAAQYFAQMTNQHGMGTRLIMGVDMESDPKKLMADYAATKTFEAFILSAFPRAVQEGIIKNKNYNVFDNWRLVPEFDEEQRTVRLNAECKRSHTVNTEDSSFKFKKDERLVFTLSHKWNQQDWTEILTAAGFDQVEFFGNKPGKKIMTARAINEPNLYLS